jgi:mono/diheme cytochrome c family protein
MFDVYCSPCHGKVQEGKIPELGTVATAGYPGVAVLTGTGGILQSRSDGQVYGTIRKGSVMMPAYGWAMTDTEMWSIVHYVRTLDQATYTPPTPVIEDGGTQ